jgi:predicted aspartyl protease
MTAPAIQALLFDAEEKILTSWGLVKDDVEVAEVVVLWISLEVNEVVSELLKLWDDWLVDGAADEDVESDDDVEARVVFVNHLWQCETACY